MMKSLKFKIFKLLALVIVMAQLASLSAIIAFASSNDETTQQTENTTLSMKNYNISTENMISAENVVIKPEREFDTYIYVIDPRSSKLVKTNVNYNDDSGEGMNPLLTTTLEANVPYLIIYSAFNPNSLTSTQDLTVKINKS